MVIFHSFVNVYQRVCGKPPDLASPVVQSPRVDFFPKVNYYYEEMATPPWLRSFLGFFKGRFNEKAIQAVNFSVLRIES
jgi:hypothetical protein